jgi:hypothetical protein
MSLYTTSGGYRLFAAPSYTPLVRRYRRAEYLFLKRLARSADTLVELGCGKAEHLASAHAFGLRYLGVDPSRPYIEQARDAISDHPSSAALCCTGAEQVEEWTAALPARHGRLLLFMPFNCLGNVPDPATVLRAVRRVPATVFFSVFIDSPEATRERRAYYARSGLRVRCDRTRWGVRAQGGGLDSTGFDARRLQREARRAGLRLRCSRLGKIGLALWGFSQTTHGRRSG